MDESYKTALTVLVPLNHSRYKDYFIQFGALNLGVFVAIATQFKDKAAFFSGAAIVLNLLWLYVQLKIAADIKKLNTALVQYEKIDCRLGLKDSQSGWPGASWAMLLVPALFLLIHIAFLACPPCVALGCYTV